MDMFEERSLPSVPVRADSPPNAVALVISQYSAMEIVARRRVADEDRIFTLPMLAGRLAYYDRHRPEALRRLDLIPSLEVLEQQAKELHLATFSAAPERDLRVIIGLTLESIPAAGNASAVFIDALVMSLQHIDDDQPEDAFPAFCGVSAPVMALAAQKLWATQKFCPAICEVLAAVRAARLEYWRAWRATRRLIALRDDAEDLIAITSPIDDDAADPDQIPF